jgi:uncharacterized integral membrane protein (TIGR00698 family)
VTGVRRVSRRIRSAVPGLLLLVALAGLAFLVAGAVPGLNALLLAVAFGAVVANVVGVPDRAAAGVRFHGVLLEAGIVLLGARVAFAELVATGPVVLGLAAAAVVFGVGFVDALARRVFEIQRETASLLAAGASVCGVSAATAVAGTIDADGESLAHVVAAILLFDAATLLVFPVAGDLLALSARQFGVWAGLSMYSTGPVTAAGFAHSAAAGQWATVTKLVRNSLLGVVALWYAVRYADRSTESGLASVLGGVPNFLVGFAFVALAANAGLFSPETLSLIETTSDGLFALAFAGLGLDVRLEAMRDAGLAPVAVLAVSLVVVSALALLAVVTLL